MNLRFLFSFYCAVGGRVKATFEILNKLIVTKPNFCQILRFSNKIILTYKREVFELFRLSKFAILNLPITYMY